MNKPVAWMYKVNDTYTIFNTIEPPDDAYDEGTLTPLYTHPIKELNNGGEPVKNATYWKRQHDNLLMKLNTCAIKVSELEKKAHPVKELMNEEIEELIWNTTDMKDFARAILRKAQEK